MFTGLLTRSTQAYYEEELRRAMRPAATNRKKTVEKQQFAWPLFSTTRAQSQPE